MVLSYLFPFIYNNIIPSFIGFPLAEGVCWRDN